MMSALVKSIVLCTEASLINLNNTNKSQRVKTEAFIHPHSHLSKRKEAIEENLGNEIS